MKGRDRFSEEEARRIRGLLRQVRRSDRAGQKVARAQLRRTPLCFYITDWDKSQQGFTAADFDGLVARGLIEIVAA